MTPSTTLQNPASIVLFPLCNEIGKALTNDFFGRLYSEPSKTIARTWKSYSTEAPFTTSWGATAILTNFAMSKMSCFKSLPSPAQTSVAFATTFATFLATAIAFEQAGINLPPQEAIAVAGRVTIVMLSAFAALSFVNGMKAIYNDRASQVANSTANNPSNQTEIPAVVNASLASEQGGSSRSTPPSPRDANEAMISTVVNTRPTPSQGSSNRSNSSSPKLSPRENDSFSKAKAMTPDLVKSLNAAIIAQRTTSSPDKIPSPDAAENTSGDGDASAPNTDSSVVRSEILTNPPRDNDTNDRPAKDNELNSGWLVTAKVEREESSKSDEGDNATSETTSSRSDSDSPVSPFTSDGESSTNTSSSNSSGGSSSRSSSNSSSSSSGSSSGSSSSSSSSRSNTPPPPPEEEDSQRTDDSEQTRSKTPPGSNNPAKASALPDQDTTTTSSSSVENRQSLFSDLVGDSSDSSVPAVPPKGDANTDNPVATTLNFDKADDTDETNNGKNSLQVSSIPQPGDSNAKETNVPSRADTTTPPNTPLPLGTVLGDPSGSPASHNQR